MSQKYQTSRNAPRNLQMHLALPAFIGPNLCVWILIFVSQVFSLESTSKSEISSCSQVGKPEKNVTLMYGLDDPMVHRQILGHVKTLEECVQIACRRRNITLAYISRFDCFGISCYGEEERCWLLPSFQNPTLVFARLQRKLIKVENVTTNKAGKLSKFHSRQKHDKKPRSIDKTRTAHLPSKPLDFKRRSMDEKLISTFSTLTRSRRNDFPSEYNKLTTSRSVVRDKPFLELPYLWKRRRKRRDVDEEGDNFWRNFVGIVDYIHNKKRETNNNEPLKRVKRDIEDDLPDQPKGKESGNEVGGNSQEALERYKRDFDDDWLDDPASFREEDKLENEEREVRRYKRKLDEDDDDDKSSTDASKVWSSLSDKSDSYIGVYSGYDEPPSDKTEDRNSLRRYKRKVVEPEEMDELSKVLSSSSPSSKSSSNTKLRRSKASTTKTRTKKITSKPASSLSSSSSTISSSPILESLHDASVKGSKSKKKDSLLIKKVSPVSPQESVSSSASSTISISSVPPPPPPPPPPSSTSSSTSVITSTSTASSPSSSSSSTKVSPSITVPKSLMLKPKKNKSKKKDSLLIKKASPVSPQESASSSASSTILISSVPPPPPPSSTSSSTSVITSTSTASSPSSSSSSTKVSSSTTVPKSLMLKPKKTKSKKKDSLLIKKASPVSPQESVSSSASSTISISSVPPPPPPPPPSSTSSSTSVITSTSTASSPSSSSSSTKVSSSTTVPKSLMLKPKKTKSKKKDSLFIKKASPVSPQESVSSSASSTISISSVPPPPPPSSTSSSTSVITSTSTASSPSSSSSSTKVSSSTTVPKSLMLKPKKTKSKKKDSLLIKKASPVSPQESVSSSASSTISISSVPPPPPPSSTSSSTSVITSTSTASSPSSSSSSTKVSSSTTVPKSLMLKPKKTKSKKKDSLLIKKASPVSPQESVSSSASSTISISSVPPPPPPSSTSSSTSVITSTSTASSPSSSSSSTKVSSSTTVPKSLMLKPKKTKSKKKDSLFIKKASPVSPQESVSSSASSTISISSVPPPPPPSSTSSSTSVITSTSTASSPSSSSSSTKVSSSTTVPKSLMLKPKKNKSKKKDSLFIKKASPVSPQESVSSSASSTISISSVPPPPPSSTSSSTSVITSTSTASSPSSSSSSSSSTKVTSSTTVPKSLMLKMKDAPAKPVKLVSPESLIKVNKAFSKVLKQKPSADPPQNSVSSSSSSSITISSIPPPPPPPPLQQPSSTSSSMSVSTSTSTGPSTQSSTSTTKVSSSTTVPKSKKKDEPVKKVSSSRVSKKFSLTKKASAVPPQNHVSSSSSSSITISSVPPPPPPPPSTSSSTSVTTSSSQSSIKVSTSSTTVPKSISSKNKDSREKPVKKAATPSIKLPKSTTSKTKISVEKSRTSSNFSSKKEIMISKKSKHEKNVKRTSFKKKEKGQIRKVKEISDKTKHKRQASYGMGLDNRIGVTGYKQGTRSFTTPVFANTFDYNHPKAFKGTHFKSLQQNGPLNLRSYTGMPGSAYQGFKAVNPYRQSTDYFHQERRSKILKSTNSVLSYQRPGVSGVGSPSAQPFIASKSPVPFGNLISTNTQPSSQLRPAFPPTNYAAQNIIRANYPQIRLQSTTYGNGPQTYGQNPVVSNVFHGQLGRFMPAQMKSHIANHKPVPFSSTLPEYAVQGKSCDYALGMQDGTIKDDQLSSSSDYSKYHTAARGRLGNTPKQNGLAGAWCTGSTQIDNSQYLQIDLGQRKRVCRVATQGMPEFPIWVKEYTLEFSNNGHIWADYTEEGHEKLFDGNKDSNTPVSHSLKQPITARFIRFKPKTWNGASICMRAEVYTSTDPELTSRDKISKQGLVVYLNFDKSKENLSQNRRTEISRAPGVCGEVATLRNGSSILLDGRKIQSKPRDAITIAAWIRLDNTSGQHSIFDTVGGHSSHGDGQYHFEVSDGKLRWYHRNETADQIFSVESDAVVTENTWTHVAGTYDSHTGISKVYIDGHVNGQAQGSGLLSQDWEDHVGIGRHKDSRFLEGMLDEFRIYDYAMEEPEIKKLMTICDYAKSCGGLLDSPTGVIESPNWPNGYKDAKMCTWKITVDKTGKIALNFEKFDLQEDGNCDKSKLVINDGEDEKAKEIGEFCGLNSPRIMTSTGNQMWIRFTSTPEGEGRGFRLTYQTEENRQTKKEERPGVPLQSTKCSASTPEYNVTLTGGINAGSFSEALGVNNLDMCMRQCCLKDSCDLAFMISNSCYLVKCKDEESCKTKKARVSGMNPTIVYIKHLHEQPQMHLGLPEEGVSQNEPRPIPPASQCHHTDVNYNVTLVGGIKAGKFNTYGHMNSIDDCIRHCCHDDKCDVAFMIQNNCYNVECANDQVCQMKKAKPSPYNPTLAYVYRGDNKPIAEPITKFDKPVRSSCHSFQVSPTLHNVTLVGGIKSGKFNDKGVVNDIEECKAYCCAEDSCNVAFLIRSNCFLVTCKDYESCKVKPALSDYYHPRLAYVNWNPPEEEVGPNEKFAGLGCWRDTESFAIPSLEGTDPLLTDSYKQRVKPIDTCANVAFKHGYKVFGIHGGGACFSGSKADETFNKFGESANCKNGRGGVGATDVYRLDYEGKYSKIGCWRDSSGRALKVMEHTDPMLNDFYQTRTSPIAKCSDVAKKQGYPVFAIQDGGECLSGPTAEDMYNKFGVSRDCRGRLGGAYANSVYKLIGNFDIQSDEADNSSTSVNSTENSSSKTSLSKPEEKSSETKQVVGEDLALPAKTDATSMSEDFITMKNGKPKRIVYTAGRIQYNVTLKYGIKSGKFMDEGKVSNISQCTSSCGRQPDCDLAFMLGQQCFAVSCKSKEFCVTKPAFSAFYNPVIVFVTHRKVFDTVKSHQKRCHVSNVQNDVTLVGGINAGKFIDLGQISDMNVCIKRCCAKPTCDVAFVLEEECYGVSCISNKLCETRSARNPGRYKPQIAYVYHDRKGLDRVQEVDVTNEKTHDKHETKTKLPLKQAHVTTMINKADTSVVRNQHRNNGTKNSLCTSTTRNDKNRYDSSCKTIKNNTTIHYNYETVNNVNLHNKGKGVDVNDDKNNSDVFRTNSYRLGDEMRKGSHGDSINTNVMKTGVNSQSGYFTFVKVHNNHHHKNNNNSSSSNNSNSNNNDSNSNNNNNDSSSSNNNNNSSSNSNSNNSSSNNSSSNSNSNSNSNSSSNNNNNNSSSNNSSSNSNSSSSKNNNNNNSSSSKNNNNNNSSSSKNNNNNNSSSSNNNNNNNSSSSSNNNSSSSNITNKNIKNDKNKNNNINNNNSNNKKFEKQNKNTHRKSLLDAFVLAGQTTNQNMNKINRPPVVIKEGFLKTKVNKTDHSHIFFNGGLTKIAPIEVTGEEKKPTYVESNQTRETDLRVLVDVTDNDQGTGHISTDRNFLKHAALLEKNKENKGMKMTPHGLVALGPNRGNVFIKPLNHLASLQDNNNHYNNYNNNNIKGFKVTQNKRIGLVALGPNSGNVVITPLNHPAYLQNKNNKNNHEDNNNDLKATQSNKQIGLVALGPNSGNVVITPLKSKGFHSNWVNSYGQNININGHGLQKIKLDTDVDATMTTNQQTGPNQNVMLLANLKQKSTNTANQKNLSDYIHLLNTILASNDTGVQGDSNSTGGVCWDGDVLYNQTLIGGINAGVFTDNGKTTTMDLCMQSCCKQPKCDLAFMIEDDCYSVACTSPSSCKTRAARPTQFYPRISFTNNFKDLMSKETSGLSSGTSSPQETSNQGPTQAVTQTNVQTTMQPRPHPTVNVQHSCSATPIKYNVTLKMGLHSGLFTKLGRVDSMDDCIELNCKQPKADVAFMMGTHCYAVQCYSEDLCKTEPVFATSFSFLNLRPAVSFLKKNPGFAGNALAQQDNPRETCLESTINYNVTLRGGIHAGKFTERPHVTTIRGCIAECCDVASCDLAFMFGNRCYSVTCKSEKSCQAVLAKPTPLDPRIAYMSRNSPNSQGLSLAESDDVHPRCHVEDIPKSLIARNKTLVGGLEAGTFRFLGKVKGMGFCMRMCCSRPRCDVAYLIDKNCFSITCFSPELCKITAEKSPTNGDVEISAMLRTVKKEELPEDSHSVVVYIIVGTLLFAAGLGGIVWAVCMFLRRHRLRQRHRARSPSDG